VPEIFPFPISIRECDLTDLRTRVDLTRLPEPQTVPDATQASNWTARGSFWMPGDTTTEHGRKIRVNAPPKSPFSHPTDSEGASECHRYSSEPSDLEVLSER
jgi:hypothetical protein